MPWNVIFMFTLRAIWISWNNFLFKNIPFDPTILQILHLVRLQNSGQTLKIFHPHGQLPTPVPGSS